MGGHPLLLSILNSLVAEAEGDWSIAESLGTTDAHLLSDVRRQRVCHRILKQHRESLFRELAFITWCAAPLIDTALLREVCSTVSEYDLRRRHFLSGEAYGTVRVNDLVFDSVVESNPCPAETAREFTAALARFIDRSLDDEHANKLPLLRAARVHRDLIARQLAGASPDVRTRAALRYAYAIARDSATDLALMGDPVAESQILASATSTADDAIRVRSVIEAVEATFSIMRSREGENAAIAYHQSLLPTFSHLQQLTRLSPELRQEIDLHEAKALYWSRKKNEAEAAFRRLLAADPNLAAARVQLGRLLAERANGAPGIDSDAAVAQFEAIMAQDPGTVTITVSLAAFGFLRRVDPERAIHLIRHHRERLLGDLRKAVTARLEQPFEVVAGLGSLLWYHAGDLLDDLFDTVSDRTVPGADDAAIFAWAQAQRQHAKSKLERGLRTEDARPLLRAAVATYEQMGRLKDRERVQFAECLLLASEPARALTVLDGVESDRSAHWHHRRAQAHLALGAAAALDAINAAISGNHDEKFQATFLHERWLIRRTLKDADAIVDLREAYRVCKAGKYKEQLGRELEIAEQVSIPAAT